MVISETESSETASRPYRNSGKRRHSRSLCVHARSLNVDAASGRLKQPKSRSEHDRFIMNMAVELRVCLPRDRATMVSRLPGTPTMMNTMQATQAKVSNSSE